MYIKCTKAHSANTMLTTFHTRHKLYTLYNLNTRTKRISETLRNSCGNENNKENIIISYIALMCKYLPLQKRRWPVSFLSTLHVIEHMQSNIAY